MHANEIRQLFLDYFSAQDHANVPGASLVPINDPSLLFVNAGMVQFKEYFLGAPAPYQCAVTAQPCLRVGGKHNDLKNVGHTTRHHTLFEMLGNFSFGDYFKEKAIELAWRFITQSLNIPQDKLWVTVHHDDQESYDIWLKDIGLDSSRIIKCGDEDNFWSMGETGPCGPCTEIFYDHGPSIKGGLPGTEEADGDRYVEIWNLVFMQFDRQSDGQKKPLPKPCVDTGMGLERIAAVMQGVTSNFETDGFQYLINQIKSKLGKVSLSRIALQVMADHLRSSTFIMAQGIYPGNEGRAYVLRRIIRRALRYAYQCGQKEPIMYHFVADVVENLGNAYPILNEEQLNIEAALKKEEEKFYQTLEQGMNLLESALEKSNMISGDLAFKLYDTYGFPIDIAEDVAKEKNIEIDIDGFETNMAKQRQRSKASSKFSSQQALPLEQIEPTVFVGATTLESNSNVIALIEDGKRVKSLSKEGLIILNETPFYPEGGGQIGDSGHIFNDNFKADINDTQKQGDVIIHYAKVVQGQINLQDKVNCIVDNKRLAVKRHHSATHLLHAALRHILGSTVEQKGSLVNDMRLRFDFTYDKPMTLEQQIAVERLVNEKIYAALPVKVEEMTMDQALSEGAIALFNDKYQSNVRVLSMGDFSKELCGGTHVDNTQDIGLFKIVTETGVASGVRRIEALAGDKALDWYESKWQTLKEISSKLKTPTTEVDKKIDQLVKDNKQLREQLNTNSKRSHVTLEPEVFGDYKLFFSYDPNVSAKELMAMTDQLKSVQKSIIFLFGGEGSESHPYVLALNKNALSDDISAFKLLDHLKTKLEIKGGGRDDMIRGVCKGEVETIKNVVSMIKDLLS
ncbi:MAG: alanine--tRNA ligase [Pseudomonadota bacterium]|nr:alanine--tRNA ligase [Pseudomonadota bacterium]